MNNAVQQRIGAVRSGKTDTLDLAGFDLTELPEEVFSLSRLRVLTVDNGAYKSKRGFLNMLRNGPNKYPELLEIMVEEARDRQAELALPRQLRYLDDRIG